MNIQPITLVLTGFGVIIGAMSIFFLAKATYKNSLNDADEKLIKTLKTQVQLDSKAISDLQRQNNNQSAVILYLQEQIEDVRYGHHDRIERLEANIPQDLAVWLRSISRKLDNNPTNIIAQNSETIPENTQE